MMLALEAEYDSYEFWYQGRYLAEVVSEQEVQPIFTMKDTWERCVCEGAEALDTEGYGQIDQTTGEEFREYIWCPAVGGAKGGVVDQYRYDWRPGRELTEEQATRWAVAHRHEHTAHHLFNGPRKEGTASVHLPASNGVGISRAWLDEAIGDSPTIEVEYATDLGPVGYIRVSDGEHWLSVPVAGHAVEGDREFLENIVRQSVERFAQLREQRERSRRESGGADSGGPSTEGTAPGGGTSALQA